MSLAGAWAVGASQINWGGPWAWLVYGLGAILSFIVGYTIGSSVMKYIWEMTIEEW